MSALPNAPTLGAAHLRRLRALWRSAGWPSHDVLELELLAAGLVQRREDAQGRETLRVTDAGVALLVETLQRNRARRDAHEALVARVATEMQRAGRIAWRGLALRAPLAEVVAAPGGGMPPGAPGRIRWAVAMPDVFSVRNTTAEALLWPVVHEVKVSRADLLGDLKRPAKGEAYRAIASECWYVLRAGIGEADEIPELYGVMRAHPAVGEPCAFGALEVLRPAPRRPFSLPFSVWMALAKATPEPFDDSDAQALLGDDAAAPAPE
jgi:hypothetical protein